MHSWNVVNLVVGLSSSKGLEALDPIPRPFPTSRWCHLLNSTHMHKSSYPMHYLLDSFLPVSAFLVDLASLQV